MTNLELKSKVVTLANKLAPRMGGDKSAAFARAWAIVKAGGLEFAVKGTSFGNRQEALKRFAAYAPEARKAVLVPEENNPADKNAIAVLVGVNGGKGLFHMGYVPRELAPVLAAMRGTHALQFPAVRVVSGTWGFSHRTSYGARVALGI